MLFSSVPGHAEAKSRLIKTITEDRISHAQLFVGSTGAGALALAMAYAQLVNCRNPQSNDSCGECTSCRQMQKLEHPDVHFTYPVIARKSGDKPKCIDYIEDWRKEFLANPYIEYNDWMNAINAENKQGNINVEECREIIRHLSLMPVYEGYKIQVIWLPEYLGKEGNILLKILEEPAPKTVFLLVCEKEENLLPTIISRTQIIRIPRMDFTELVRYLVRFHEIPQAQAESAAALSEGNLNLALSILKDGEQNHSEEFIKWMRFCWKNDVVGLAKWVDGMAETGRENQKNFISYSLRMIRESLLLNRNLDSMNRLLPSEKDFTQKFAPFIHPENIHSISERLNNAHYYIERNGQPKMIFFTMSLRMAELLKMKKPSLV